MRGGSGEANLHRAEKLGGEKSDQRLGLHERWRSGMEVNELHRHIGPPLPDRFG
jgi:hypothetical protein